MNFFGCQDSGSVQGLSHEYSFVRSAGFLTSFRHTLLCPLRSINLKSGNIDRAIESSLLAFPGDPIQIIPILSSSYLQREYHLKIQCAEVCRALDGLIQGFEVFLLGFLQVGSSSSLTSRLEEQLIPIWVLNRHEETPIFRISVPLLFMAAHKPILLPPPWTPVTRFGCQAGKCIFSRSSWLLGETFWQWCGPL